MKTTTRRRRLSHLTVSVCLLSGAASAFQCHKSAAKAGWQLQAQHDVMPGLAPSDDVQRAKSPMDQSSSQLAAPSSPISSASTSGAPSIDSSQFQQLQLQTLQRILLPSIALSVTTTLLFPSISLTLTSLLSDSAVLAVLAVDSSQFIQNFLTVTGLTFSILVGQTYYFMYQQQESVFNSLYLEVTEAKSLVEQLALVCRGRKGMYRMCLKSVYTYVQHDLRYLHREPAEILSARPMDDPLEIVLYLTSVGVPSSVYDTVRSLRRARSQRLASLQKKLPPIHMGLLWLLAMIELSSFPVLGAGTQSIGGYNILTLEGIMFGILTFGVVLTLNVVGELYMGEGGAYNVDSVLDVMVRGLEEELVGRLEEMSGDDLEEDDGLLFLGGEDGEMPSPLGLGRQRYFDSYENGEDDSVEENSI